MTYSSDELRQAAVEIAALDAKRTPGDWTVTVDPGSEGCEECGTVGETHAHMVAWQGTVGLALIMVDERDDENAAFIAAAPRMASLIAAQAERIRQLEAYQTAEPSGAYDNWRRAEIECGSLRATIASQAAEVEGLRVKARLHDSLERAAGELPDFCVIELCVEKGAGYVELNHGDGFMVAIDSADRSLSEQVDEAIRAAMAAKGSGT